MKTTVTALNFEYHSDFSKLCRITACVIRFVNNIKAQSSKPVSPVGSGSLNSEEVLFRESLWILESQKSLLLNRNFKQQCAELGVIKDMNGILRCKGKICNSSLRESIIFPTWLPCDHHITRLIIRDCHHRVMHNGVKETLTEFRSFFWLTKGRQVIRKQIYNCIVCRRHDGRSYKVEQASAMPEFRFKEGYPFASTGADCAGPLFVKTVFRKEIQVSKVYICLFICESTRAIHIEVTPGLIAQASIHCLQRFVARRVIPELVISDSAKTFKAAATQPTKVFKDPYLMSFLLERKILWKFNLERAPW